MRKLLIYIMLSTFMATAVVPPSHAQTLLGLPEAGAMVGLSQPFAPAVLRGVKVDQADPFKFDFLVDPGDTGLSADALGDEAMRLIKYFMVSVTTPEQDVWVNLSPYEKDRIIPEAFGTTEMGRDLLAQDYILKQLTATLMYPESAQGKVFWQKVYSRAFELYGTTDVPVDTFNKVWIMPASAEVYEDKGVAYLGNSHLKVMLESDYLAMRHSERSEESQSSLVGANDGMVKSILRELMIPLIEEEVNTGRHFAPLRQVYQSLILAAWYKHRLKEGVFNRAYADRSKVAGVEIDDTNVAQKIYAQYLEAFKKGVYNYVKEERAAGEEMPVARKYFSGGFSGGKVFDDAMSFKSLADLKAWKSGLHKVVVKIESIFKPAAVKDDPLFLSVGPQERQQLEVTLLKMIREAGHDSPEDMVKKTWEAKDELTLGTGFEGSVLSVLGISSFCLKFLKVRTQRVGVVPLELRAVKNILPGRNVGQEIARIGEVKVLLMQTGETWGITKKIEEEYGQDLEKLKTYHQQMLRELAAFPSESFDEFIDVYWDIIKGHHWVDINTSENLIVDRGTKKIKFIDITPDEGTGRSDLVGLFFMLVDRRFLLRNYWADSHPSDELKGSIIEVAQKLILAFERRFGEKVWLRGFQRDIDARYSYSGKVDPEKGRFSSLFAMDFLSKPAAVRGDDAELKGGIDLDARKIDLAIRGDGSAGGVVSDPEGLERYLNAEGFSPVIVSIAPVNDVAAFYGLPAR